MADKPSSSSDGCDANAPPPVAAPAQYPTASVAAAPGYPTVNWENAPLHAAPPHAQGYVAGYPQMPGHMGGAAMYAAGAGHRDLGVYDGRVFSTVGLYKLPKYP